MSTKGAVDKNTQSEVHVRQEAFAAIRAAHGRYQVNRKGCGTRGEKLPNGVSRRQTAWVTFPRMGWSAENG